MIMKEWDIKLSFINFMRLEDGFEIFFRDCKRENKIFFGYQYSDMKIRFVCDGFWKKFMYFFCDIIILGLCFVFIYSLKLYMLQGE